jgi:hypothetical protein
MILKIEVSLAFNRKKMAIDKLGDYQFVQRTVEHPLPNCWPEYQNQDLTCFHILSHIL